jgi:hypothetical protein
MDEHNFMDDQAGQVPEGYEPGSDADIHVSSIVFTGVIGAVLLIVIVMLLKALYYHTLEVERMHKQGKGIDVTLSDLRGKQLEQIGQYRWVNAHTGAVGLPIEDAMRIVWQEQAAHANEGIEITDWDHNPSDQHAVPGDLVMYGVTDLNDNGFGEGIQAVVQAMAQRGQNTDNQQESGAEAAGGDK